MRTVPSTERGRATLERIVDAAALLFYRQGVGATGLEQIIEASDSGKGQIYHYFSGKPDLVVAVIERQVEQVLEAQQPQLAAIDSFATLDAWLQLLVRLHATSDHPLRCPLGALTAELAEADPDARGALRTGMERWTALIAEGLARMQAAGELNPAADADELAQSTLASYQGGLVLAQVEGSIAPLRAALDGAAAALAAHRA